MESSIVTTTRPAMADNKLELVVAVEVDKANQPIKSVNGSLSSNGGVRHQVPISGCYSFARALVSSKVAGHLTFVPLGGKICVQ